MWPHWEEEPRETESSKVHVWGPGVGLKFKQKVKDLNI